MLVGNSVICNLHVLLSSSTCPCKIGGARGFVTQGLLSGLADEV